MLVTIIAAVVAFGFGFLVGNRSGKGEGAALLAAAKAETAKVVATAKTDAAAVTTEAKKI
jgi:hypothetical protein